MTLLLLAYFGGVLTIVSPGILPVLPFVFAKADRPFIRSGLPMLAGMAVTFAAVATLAAVAGGWAVAANEYARMAAIVLLALFGITLLFPDLSVRVMQPLVALGARLSQSAERGTGTVLFAAMKRSLGVGEWIRRGWGAAVLVAVAIIALGLDTKFLTRVSLAGTTPLEHGLLERFHSAAKRQVAAQRMGAIGQLDD